MALAGPDTAEPLEVKAVAGEGKAGAVALRPGDEVTVIVHPRSVTLHATDPGDREANVHRCEILQSIPVSADFSTGDGAMLIGLRRVRSR